MARCMVYACYERTRSTLFYVVRSNNLYKAPGKFLQEVELKKYADSSLIGAHIQKAHDYKRYVPIELIGLTRNNFWVLQHEDD